MRIDISYATPAEPHDVDEVQYLSRVRARQRRQALKRIKHGPAITEIAKSNLSDDEGVRDHETRIQKIGECRVSHSQVINPDRGIDQNQTAVAGRRRSATESPGSLPPS